MSKTFTVLCLLLSLRGFSQDSVYWYDPIPVADKTYGNLHPRIALDQNNNPLVLWGHPDGKAFIARWAGKQFAEPLQINIPGRHVFTESWAGPEMDGRGDTIYVVYKVTPEENNHIFIKHSYDGGKNFSIEAQVDTGNYISRFPTVAMDPYGSPLVAYMKLDKGYTNPRYVVARSRDLGESFPHESVVADFSGGKVSDCCPATVIESGNATIILYRDNLNGLRNIWAGISSNMGVSFKRGLQVDQTNWTKRSCPANAPDGIIISDTLYTVFMSGAGDSSLVYLSKTSVTGLSAVTAPVTGKFTGLGSQNFPRIANSGNAAALAWEQSVGSITQVCLLFTNEITNGFPALFDTVANGHFENLDVALGGGHIYVVYQDDSSGNIMCRIGRYNETIVNKLLAENTTVALKTAPSGKYFTVSIPGISSCLMLDMQGKEFEMDLKCNKNSCRVYTEDLDPGLYIVKIYCKDDKAYTYKYEVKEVQEKEEKEKK
jgi:hypothetical protein